MQDEEEGGAVEETQPAEWGTREEATTVHIETGRGATVEVPVGSNFKETMERVADGAHYGGYFRVFLNGEELVEPEESPEVIEAGMRIAITSYDKVG